MKIAVFDAKAYDMEYLEKYNNNHHFVFWIENLTLDNIHELKNKGFQGVCGFVNTYGDREIIKTLKSYGIKYWFQRSMGYEKIDLKAAKEFDLKIFRVPNYSAESIAEHAVGLLLALNRKLNKAYLRTKKYDFSLDGLQGKVINNSCVGVIGSGKIGQSFINIMNGFGAKILVFDEWAQKNNLELAQKNNFQWVTLDELLNKSDFISLHAPLLHSTEHIINENTINKMKQGVIIINTSRGELINTQDLINGFKLGKISGAGLDVVEREEERVFFDLSNDKDNPIKNDKEWNFLLNHENVIITAHQAFFTTLALEQIAQTTIQNINNAQNNDYTLALELLEEDGKVLNG